MGDIGSEVGSLLMISKEQKELGHPDASMLYCRKANECMLKSVYEEAIGKIAPTRDPKGGGSAFLYLLHSIQKQNKKEEIKIPFNKKKFESINRMTRGYMHYNNELGETSNISDLIDDVHALITSLFEELFPDSKLIVSEASSSDSNLKIIEEEAERIRFYGTDVYFVMRGFAELGLYAIDRGLNLNEIDKITIAEALFVVGKIDSAMKIAEDLKSSSDIVVKATLRRLIGRKLRQDGALQDALENLESSKEMFLAESNGIEAALTCFLIGDIFSKKGDLELAKRNYNFGIKLSERCDNSRGRAIGLSSIANMHLRSGELEEAEKQFNAALEISIKIGDFQRRASILGSLANIRIDQGNNPAAKEFLEQSLEIARKFHYKRGEAISLQSLGKIARIERNLHAAERFLGESLQINRQINDYGGILACLGGIGKIAEKRDQEGKAIELYYDCFNLAEKSGDLQGMATASGNIGGIYLKLKRYDDAKEELNRALIINEEAGLNRGIAIILSQIGRVEFESGDFESAKEYFTKSLEMNRESGRLFSIAFNTNQLGRLAVKMNDDESAILHYSETAEINEKLKNHKGAIFAYRKIQEIYSRKGDLDMVEEYELKIKEKRIKNR